MRTHAWTVHVPTSPANLWDFLIDYTNQLELCAESASASLIAGDMGRVGATYRVVVPWEGLKAEFEAQLLSAEPPRRMIWSSTTSQSEGSAAYELAPAADGGTDMTLELTLAMRGAFAPLEPFGWSLLSRFAEKMLEGLARTYPSTV
jgi:uncharacterized protein YndB with AHSA1/START domain